MTSKIQNIAMFAIAAFALSGMMVAPASASTTITQGYNINGNGQAFNQTFNLTACNGQNFELEIDFTAHDRAVNWDVPSGCNNGSLDSVDIYFSDPELDITDSSPSTTDSYSDSVNPELSGNYQVIIKYNYT